MKLKKETLNNHSVAPYNFVSLPNRSVAPYTSVEDLPKHNKLNEELLNGTIEFDIIAKTPLLIAKGKEKNGSGDAEFFTNPLGNKVIPGNTLRGMLRNNAAVLSMSNISDDIVDSRFYFRSFSSTSTQQEYKDRLQIKAINENGVSYSVAKTIKAGYIYKRGHRDYVIVPGKKLQGEQYFRISEQYLRVISNGVKIDYMYNDRIKELITNKIKYKKNDRDKKFFLKGIVNRNYKPYCNEISFELKDKRTLKKIDKKGNLKNNGYLISSNYLYGKLAHYVISEPDYDSTEVMELNEKNGLIKYIEFYEDDLLRTKKVKDEKEENFFTLPKELGKENGKPIFYGEFKGKVYLGFTPYFRIPYDKSLKEGIADKYINSEGLSYCDSIFGFTNKFCGKDNKISYKGRVSVEDAQYVGKININTTIEEKDSYRVILSEPHGTCFTNYLKQDSGATAKNLITYNSEEFEIGGIKNYWQKDYLEYILQGKADSKIETNLIAVKIGSKFTSKIHFNNMSQEELGLLLWALKVDEKANENIGMGKPFGFGRVEISNINVNVEDLNKKYTSMSMEFYKDIDKKECIEKYKDDFKLRFNVDLDAQAGVRELVSMKTTVVTKDKYNEARHMEISCDAYKDTNKGKAKNEFTLGLPLLSPIKQSEIIQGKKVNISTPKKDISSQNRNQGKKDSYTRNKQIGKVYKDDDSGFGSGGFDVLQGLFK